MENRDITLRKGETFQLVIRYEDKDTPVQKAVTGITKAAPPVVTCVGHGVPTGWRVAISNAGGMKQINAANDQIEDVLCEDWHIAQSLSADTLSLPFVNASNYSAYTSGGVLMYYAPVDLTSAVVRMQVRASEDATTTVLDLSSPGAGVAIDNTNKTITVTATAAQTAALAISRGVYDLEVQLASGQVCRLYKGDVTVEKEVTK